MSIVLWSGNNTLLIEGVGLTNNVTGEQIDDATVTCSIYYAGELLEGETWPVEMNYDSNGDYSATISAETDIRTGRSYDVVISVTSGTNKAEFKKNMFAKQRGIDSQ